MYLIYPALLSSFHIDLFFFGGDRIHSKVLGMKFWCRQSVPEIGVNIGRKELEENPGEARWVS